MTTVEFHKYHSIENTYRGLFLEQIRALPCSQQEWCVMEKVHGANLSFTTNGEIVRVGKRTSFLTNETTSETDFFNCNELVARTLPKIKNIPILPSVKFITVYGELFGGYYDGMKITHKAIQKGIQYCPQQEFIAFDIRVTYEDGRAEYMNYDKAIAIFRDIGLLYAEILFRGSMEACLKWSTEHNTDQTTIPSVFGLDEKKNNTREGHVLKPLEPACTVKGEAVVLKDKNDRFKEKERKTYKEPVSEEQANALQDMINEALLYVTDARYDGIISKYGPRQSDKDIGKYVGLFTQDVMKDYLKDVQDTKTPIDKPIIKQINTKVTDTCRKFVLRR